MNTAIDRETLLNLYGELNEDVAGFFTEFIAAYPAFRSDCANAFNDGALQSLEGTLHQYGPAFTYVGFPQVTTAVKQLENDCKSAVSVNDIAPQYNELIMMTDAALVEIRKEELLLLQGAANV
jgi:hypothetical protein